MPLTSSDCRELVSPVRLLTVAASVPSVTAAPSVPGVLAPQLAVGASGLTVTASVMLAVLVLPSASCVVAVAVRVKFASLVGVTVRLESVQPLTLTAVLPALAVKLWPCPSLSVAPTGIALTSSDCSELLSPVRLLTLAASVPSVTAAPSVPGVLAPPLGVGASGLAGTAAVPLAVLVLPSASSVVAVAVRVKFASLVGVTVRLDSVQPLTLTEVLPALAVKLWPCPSLSVAPTGIELTSSDCRELLSPVRLLTLAASVPSVTAAPSVPGVLAPQLAVGASGLTVTASVTLAVLVLPSASRVVAVAVRVKFASLVGVTVRLDSVQPLTLTEVLPALAVKLWPWPSLSVAPTGIELTSSDCSELLSPVRLLMVAASVPSVTAAPSVPGVLAPQLAVGASGLTVTASVTLAVLVLPSASSVVAVAVRVKFASLVGVTVRLESVQPLTLTEVLPALAVKLWPWPSLSVAPTGIALTSSDCSELLSPVRLLTLAARVPSVTAAPSVPGVLAPQVAVGASGLTVTASVTLAVLVLPSASSVVAVAVRVKFASLVGVTVRLESVQPLTLTEVLPALAVKLWA